MLATSKEALNAAIEAANSVTEDDIYTAFARKLDPELLHGATPTESGSPASVQMVSQTETSEKSQRPESSNTNQNIAEDTGRNQKRRATVKFDNSDTLLKAKRRKTTRKTTRKTAPLGFSNTTNSYEGAFAGWENIPALKKLHHLAVFIRSSAIHSDDWREIVQRALGIDNVTRWSSWYYVLSIAIKKRDEITTYMVKNFKALDGQILSDDEWDFLEKTHKFLAPFKHATKKSECHSADLSQTLTIMDALLLHYESSKVCMKHL